MPEFRTKVKIAEVCAVHETQAALLCEIDGKQVWIPKSQIDDDSEVWETGQEGVLVVSEFIAAEKGLV